MYQLTRKLSEGINALKTFVIVQGVYKSYDTDGSGVIGADELPNAFRAAGEFFSLSILSFKCLLLKR